MYQLIITNNFFARMFLYQVMIFNREKTFKNVNKDLGLPLKVREQVYPQRSMELALCFMATYMTILNHCLIVLHTYR